ncbi:hypothetical protein [Marinomonas aquiplantarum]|uniref:Uncharacterized protein n=1 Tax=Marinomonas aquiplantarum TaxID=491951 RepID=A0A366CX43_9GAMM|nr:hypothetical protein [Marinomonas aquiplantarum]RBO82383.1 hypothetical protein DFP76_106211 [Marinomonas aquiplantarum]
MKDFNPDNYPQFIRVQEKDVTLKFVFDNIRNIGLSALVFALGVIIAKGEPISSLLSVPYSEVVLGIVICLSGFLLAVLNFMQGVLAILASKKFNMAVYIIFSLLLQTAVFEVFFKQAFKIINN